LVAGCWVRVLARRALTVDHRSLDSGARCPLARSAADMGRRACRVKATVGEILRQRLCRAGTIVDRGKTGGTSEAEKQRARRQSCGVTSPSSSISPGILAGLLMMALPSSDAGSIRRQELAARHVGALRELYKIHRCQIFMRLDITEGFIGTRPSPLNKVAA
jgi:hypothetical protein